MADNNSQTTQAIKQVVNPNSLDPEDYNQYFSNIASSILESYPSTDKPALEYTRSLQIKKLTMLELFPPVTPEDIVNTVDDIKNSLSNVLN